MELDVRILCVDSNFETFINLYIARHMEYKAFQGKNMPFSVKLKNVHANKLPKYNAVKYS